MAVVSKLVLTHVNGNDNVIILADGASFVLLNGEKHTKIFTENDAAAFVQAMTGIEVAIKAAKIAAGRNLQAKDKLISVLSETVDMEEGIFQILQTSVGSKVKDVWPLTVINNEAVIEFPSGVVDDLLTYLLAQGVEKAPTAGMYDKIIFVNALPEEDAEEGVAYVLDKADGDKPANSAWLFVDDDWMELSDEEASNDESGNDDNIVVEGGGEDATGFTPGPAIP